MDRFGPFEPSPLLAVAVSGGADSMALAMLARDWVRLRGGRLIALIVDHGLRPESGQEARTTLQRLGALDIPASILKLTDLRRGPALAERARDARYAVLTGACRDAACRHLLLGHHAGDQVETVAMRVLRGSRNDGLAGMSALRVTRGGETQDVRLLRPLLNVHPARLRDDLRERGIAWVEDPSNRDMRALRPRLRRGLSRMSWDTLLQAIAEAGERRVREETAVAACLADCATLHPEGFALVRADRLLPNALSALVTAVAGAPYPPDPDVVAGLAAHPASATLHGVRIMPAGRLGHGWLIVREEAFIQPPVPASPAVLWDGRFALRTGGVLPEHATIGKLGDDAAGLRHLTRLPSVILRTLPALRIGKKVAAVPHLRYADGIDTLQMTVTFAPSRPVDTPVFMPAANRFLDRAEPAAVSQGDDPACDSPPLGEPSVKVGMQHRAPHTMYPGAPSGAPNQNFPPVCLSD
jgi:tRNA(Ile)-lysidine synthase